MERLGIWSGDSQHDCNEIDAESIQRLLSCNPVLLASAAAMAAPLFYDYPLSELALLLRVLVDVINPNILRSEVSLRNWAETYAEGENRIDAEFILRSLVGDARQLAAGKSLRSDNLRVAFHQRGLREIIAVSLLLDSIKQWTQEAGN